MSVANENAVHVRWMIRRDMAEVMRIESDSFDSPWNGDDFMKMLRHRNVIGMIAEHADEIVGYSVHVLGDRHIDIANLAVRGDCRRTGIGRTIVSRLCAKMTTRRPKIMADVREGSLAAQLFFRSMGFVATQIVRDRFDDGQDAYRMVRRMQDRQDEK